MSQQTRSNSIYTIILLFAAFVLFAMPGAISQVSWPDIRDEFGLRQDSIGLLFIMNTIGHLISAAFNGRLMFRFSGRTLLFWSLVIFGLSIIGYGLAPTWGTIVTLALVGGWAAGTIDATGNTIAAARFNDRIMNWLHGFFGVGATLGPLAISLVLFLGAGWRGGPFLFGTLLLVLAGGMLLFWPMFAANEETGDAAEAEESSSSGFDTMTQPVVWIAIIFFFFYGGVEVSIGQWSFTILTESREMGEEAARFWVSVYWGTFTAGRFIFGVISPWLPPKTWIRACVILTSLSLILYLFPSRPELGLLAMALSGISQAPIFATLISMMPNLVGREHASNAIGYVVGAAGIGIAVLPSLGGVLAERISLEAIPPFILFQALMLILLFEIMARGNHNMVTNG